VKELIPYLNPVISQYILSQISNNEGEGEDGSSSSGLSIQKSLPEISSLSSSDWESFLIPKISRKLYNFFKNPHNLIKNAKLETLETIIFLFDFLIDDYKLQPEDIEKIKVQLYFSSYRTT